MPPLRCFRPIPERPKESRRPSFSLLAEAVAAARANFRGSPAEQYLTVKRRIRPIVASMYGVGYGLPFPPVSQAVLKAAQAHRLATDKGWWIWAGGLVYAEPPLEPQMIQVRHLRDKAYSKYQTWGRLNRPAGAWRVGPNTQALVVVEGMIDMLALAQVFHDHNLGNKIIPLYLAGSGSTRAYEWLRETAERRHLFLIPDADEGGKDWLTNLRRHGVKGEVFFPPDGLDPDEAVLDGWWPFPF
ncbi:MAG TPA: toprim domain-containing protein [Anaerolineae bacterium]|nr:toprim domain-containing protein [Anaerolineae bacterium]